MKRKSKVLSISLSDDVYQKIEELRKDSSRSELIREIVDLKYNEKNSNFKAKVGKNLEEKIKSKEAVIGVVGMGYVGLPLAVSAANANFRVIGFDLNSKVVKSLNQGISHITDISDKDLVEVIKAEKLEATADLTRLKEADIISICVPTPLDKFKQPDISFIKKAADDISRNLRIGQLVILESTTYPGTTEEVVLPILEKSGLKVGKDFFLVFSPERVDPGNKKFQFKDIPKVVGGVTKDCTKVAVLYYSFISDRVVEVSNPKSAELTKLLENIFRIVNISMINELTLLADKMGIDIWEVIEAAATKPYGFMPFYPSPGVGGHCIPLDPFYLSYKAKEYNFYPRFIELSGEINDQMPHFVLTKIMYAMNNAGKALKNSKILLVGLAYKKDISDTRDSASLKVLEELVKKHARVIYHDPYVPEVKVDGNSYKSTLLTAELLKEVDCVVILTDHTNVDYEKIVKYASFVVDIRNSVKRRDLDKVYHL